MRVDQDSFRVPGGELTLRPIQVEALNTLAEHRRGFFSMGVGAGKTLTAMLACKALDLDPTSVLVLTTARLRDEAAYEYERYRQHWDVPDVEYASYNWISVNDKYFWEKAPKLILADEAHMLGNPKAARTHSLLRYMRDHPETIFVPMSGTLTRTSVLEYAHLMRMALGDNSPLPTKYFQLQSISRVMDSRPMMPPDGMDYGMARRFFGGDDRAAMFRVFQNTPGVVLSLESAFDGPLVVRPWTPSLPPALRKAQKVADADLQLPNGTRIHSSLGVWEKLTQLSLGFYYYPVYTKEHTREWNMARRDKDEAIAEVLSGERRKKHGLITVPRIEQALRDGRIQSDAWDAWEPYAEVPEPEQAVEWICDDVVRAAVDRCKELSQITGKPALLWYEHKCIRNLLDEWARTDLSLFVTPRGDAPPRGEAKEGCQVVAVSMDSHATGYNLQHDYAANLLLSTPSNGGLWEQMVGRTHRDGQTLGVIVEYNASTKQFRDARFKAGKDAKYVFETLKQPQKLILAQTER